MQARHARAQRSAQHAHDLAGARRLRAVVARGRGRWLLAGAASAALLASSAVVVPGSSPAEAAEPVVSPVGGAFAVQGHGWGHGRGLSQWGAQSRALAGQSTAQILDFYYPGTGEETAPDRELRVGLTQQASTTLRLRGAQQAQLAVGDLRVPAGGVLTVVRAGAGFTGTAARADGGVEWTRTWPGTVEVSGDAAGVALVAAGGAGTVFEGRIRLVGGSGTITPINMLGVDGYVRGVVPNESPASWRPAALQAQAIAARSYALSTLTPAAAWDVCDTDACQVYRGSASIAANGATTSKQPASTNAAVAATAMRVRTHGGAVAFTQFSSSNGGWTAAGTRPYQVATEDPFSLRTGSATGDGVGTWTASLPVATVSAQCPSGGTATSLQVTGRAGVGEWGGRITALRITCTTGTVTVTGAGKTRMGLRSEWWNPVSQLSGGAVAEAWTAAGGAAGPLGAPTGTETALPGGGGTYQVFTGGSVYWSPGTGARVVSGALRDAWGARGWERSALGLPAGDAATTPDGAVYQHFTGGSLYLVTSGGSTRSVAVTTAARDAWARAGWERSWLGYPLADTVATPDGTGTYTRFAGGTVYASAAGAYPVAPSVAATWARWDWERGLGYPSSWPGTTPDGTATYQHFTGGSVYASAAGTAAVRATVRDAWGRLGWERGALGYPTADTAALADRRGQITRFTGGTVYWSQATGARATWGPVAAKWGRQGWENGWLGYPVTDVAATPDGVGRYQHFQGGSVYLTSTGTWQMTAATVRAWGAQGWERGALGYPTGDTETSRGRSVTPFAGGTVTVEAGGRVVVTRR